MAGEVPSPLERISNLEDVAPNAVQALERRLKDTYVKRVATRVKEARMRAEKLRSQVLY